MAASSSPDARGLSPGEPFRLIRELGSRPVPTWAALEPLPNGRSRIAIVERAAHGHGLDPKDIADWLRTARQLAVLVHPNVARVRDVRDGGEGVRVASEFVDGVYWSTFVSLERPCLEVSLRVLVDALVGLNALHTLRDAKRQPANLVHGSLSPGGMVLGIDGVTRIVDACRLKSAAAKRAPEIVGYLAPEVLLGDDAVDARADVYSAGVMLWEALGRRSLFESMRPSAIVTHLLSGRVARPVVSDDSPWAAPLVEVAMRAISADPGQRPASATSMAAEIRRLAGAKIADPVRVAGLVRSSFGEVIRLRREDLERGEARPVPTLSATDSQRADSDVPTPPQPWVRDQLLTQEAQAALRARPRTPTSLAGPLPMANAVRVLAPAAQVLVMPSSHPPAVGLDTDRPTRPDIEREAPPPHIDPGMLLATSPPADLAAPAPCADADQLGGLAAERAAVPEGVPSAPVQRPTSRLRIVAPLALLGALLCAAGWLGLRHRRAEPSVGAPIEASALPPQHAREGTSKGALAAPAGPRAVPSPPPRAASTATPASYRSDVRPTSLPHVPAVGSPTKTLRKGLARKYDPEGI